MNIFGATTKHIRCKDNKESTHCKVDYQAFKYWMWLYKIEYISPENPNKGDSGSIVYYRDEYCGELRKGMLVARSEN